MTSLLLDTHAMLWFFWDDVYLSAHAKALIERADNRKLVSIASCWEIAIKVGLGVKRKKLPGGKNDVLSAAPDQR